MPSGQVAFTQVPGVAVAAFASPTAEFLQIDATASLLFEGTGGPAAAYFRVMVDNEEVDFNNFAMSSTAGVPTRLSGAVTLRVPVAAGPHVVSLEWASAPAGALPLGAGGTTATVDAFGHANLRVFRTTA